MYSTSRYYGTYSSYGSYVTYASNSFSLTSATKKTWGLYKFKEDWDTYSQAAISWLFGEREKAIIAALPKLNALGVGIAAGLFVTSVAKFIPNPIIRYGLGFGAGYLAELAWEEYSRNYLSQPPLVLDLDGDGTELVSVNESSVFFDIDKDGFLEKVGWAGPDDGILVIDLGLDGQVTSADEFVFTNHATGAASSHVISMPNPCQRKQRAWSPR